MSYTRLSLIAQCLISDKISYLEGIEQSQQNLPNGQDAKARLLSKGHSKGRLCRPQRHAGGWHNRLYNR